MYGVQLANRNLTTGLTRRPQVLSLLTRTVLTSIDGLDSVGSITVAFSGGKSEKLIIYR